MKTFTYLEIIDILEKIGEEENENCKRFYALNPDSDRKRKSDNIIINSVICKIMDEFYNRYYLK